MKKAGKATCFQGATSLPNAVTCHDINSLMTECIEDASPWQPRFGEPGSPPAHPSSNARTPNEIEIKTPWMDTTQPANCLLPGALPGRPACAGCRRKVGGQARTPREWRFPGVEPESNR